MTEEEFWGRPKQFKKETRNDLIDVVGHPSSCVDLSAVNYAPVR